jgi:hypothetical protein
MSLIVACECGKKFRAKEEHTGRRTKCPICGRALVIAAEASSIARDRDVARSQSGTTHGSATRPETEAVICAEVVTESASATLPCQQGSPICFFCGRCPSREASSYQVGVFRVVRVPDKSPVSLRDEALVYCTRTESVPRCEACESAYENTAKLSRATLLWSLFAGLLVGVVCAAIQAFRSGATKPPNVLAGLSVLGGTVGAIIVLLFRSLKTPNLLKGIRPLTDARNSVNAALTHGWKLGDKPDGSLNAIHMEIGTDLLASCPVCGNRVSLEEFVYVKRQLVCKSCFGRQRFKAHFKKPKSPRRVLAGIGYCMGGIVVLLFVIPWWLQWKEQSGIDVANLLACGAIGGAVALIGFGIKALTE